MVNKRRNIRFILFLILPILAFLLGWILSQHQNKEIHSYNKTVETPKKETRFFENIKISRKSDPKNVDLSMFWETWNTLDSNFIYKDRLKDKKQIYGAIKGMVNSVDDPYTIFMTPEETSDFEKSMSDEVFEGIGAEIGVKKGELTIISPLKGSPAELAGLRSGDKVLTIDGEGSLKITAEEAVTKIRGPKGEKVVLEVMRAGENKPLTITIVRDSIVNKSLTWEIIDNIAVVEIHQFSEDLDSLFSEAIPEILLEKPEGIIIDLRNNGGGLLDVSIKVMNEFFNKEVLVSTKGRKVGQSGDFESEDGGAFIETPVIILVNQGTASASEIFAGSFQDYDRGIIIGEQTFGKGVVQNVIPLTDGSTLKVTVSEWLTPKGRSINERGITPDIEVKMTIEDYDNDIDPMIDEAFKILNTEGNYTKIIREKNDKIQEKQENIEENDKEDNSATEKSTKNNSSKKDE